MKRFGHLPIAIFLLSSLLSAGVLASTVRATNLSGFEAFASNETVPTVGMVSEIPSTGSGTDRANPIKVYIPITDTPPTDQSNATVLTSTSRMPRKKGSGGLATVMFSITAANTDTTNSMILNVGVQDATDNKFETFIPSNALADLTVTANTSKEINILVNLDNICSQVSCTSVDTATAEGQQDFKLLFFLDAAQNSNTEKTGDTDGLFVTLKFSSQIPDNTYTFNSLTKGDERLFADLAGGQLITFMGNDVYKTFVYRYSSGGVENSQSIGAAKASNGAELEQVNPVLNGQLKVTNLNNDEEYNLAFALVNKYQLASPLSASLLQTPADILALLEKQACFLATAGFQREHPVLDRLRRFRDEQLMNTTLGQKFVAAYYRTAPLFAPYIMQSPPMALAIRMAAYVFTFVLDFFWFVLALSSGAILLLLVRLWRRPLARQSSTH